MTLSVHTTVSELERMKQHKCHNPSVVLALWDICEGDLKVQSPEADKLTMELKPVRHLPPTHMCTKRHKVGPYRKLVQGGI